MRKAVSKLGVVAAAALGLALSASANTITDVGPGLVPDFEPSHYDPASGEPAWALSSSCVDISEDGRAACRAVAEGPAYGCGWRNAQTCRSSVAHVHLWNSVDLQLMSKPLQKPDVPLSMNNAGEISGYSYEGAVYPSSGGNGRIWHAPLDVESLALPVTSINDGGSYILTDAEVLGGVTHYGGTVHDKDGVEIPYPGTTLLPFVVANTGEVIGGQVIQDYLSDQASPTGDEVPEVSGVGWLLDQAEVDAIELNGVGLLDIDGDRLWPLLFYRPTGFTSYSTVAHDANDHGDFVGQTTFGGLYSGSYCTREGETDYTDYLGVAHRLAWVCDGTNYTAGTYAGGKAFLGINNVGDAVGVFTPGAYSYQTSYTQHPWAWLVNATGGRDEYDVNDLLPPDSGYTVLSVNDINDRREIVGTCTNPAGEVRGCIIHVTDPPVPADAVRPTVRIDAPGSETVSGVISVEASAWDRQSRIRKVVFQVGRTSLGSDTSRPYAAEWDTGTLAPGQYTLRVTAIDNAGNRRSTRQVVTVGTPEPPPPPPPVGDPVEGEGTILAFGTDYVDVDEVRLHLDANTEVQLNDVPGFAVGLSVQYKGLQDGDGTITATYVEVN